MKKAHPKRLQLRILKRQAAVKTRETKKTVKRSLGEEKDTDTTQDVWTVKLFSMIL